MSTIDSTHLDCIDVEQQSTDAVLKALISSHKEKEERIDQLENELAAVRNKKEGSENTEENSEQIGDTSDDLEETEQRLDALANWLENVVDDVEENADDIQQISDDLDEERETRAKESAEDRKRITELENRIEESETHPSDRENRTPETCVTPDTPLEQVTALPQEMIDEESPNVRRAIFVASGVHDYSRKVPAGRAIKSSELRKVLKAGTDANGHTETVSRVMDVLDDMGGDDVKIVDRRGEKRVVFTERAADRLTELVEQKRSSNHTVVMGETG